MTPGDIAAYIGAAAWLPQIGVWAYGALTTPKLKLVSAGNIEIWFSTAGPGANATFAFSADRRDALIEKMNLRATHQDGDKRDFDWRFLNDNQSQSRDAQGNISSQFRTIPAVALKVSTISLVEKTVGFHNAQFEEHFNPLFSQMMELYRHNETKLGSAAALEHILQSLEFEKTQRAYLESLFWRTGKWDFLFTAKLSGMNQVHAQRFTVTFKDEHIVFLRRNTEQFVPYVKAACASGLEQQALYRMLMWSYAYPSVKSA